MYPPCFTKEGGLKWLWRGSLLRIQIASGSKAHDSVHRFQRAGAVQKRILHCTCNDILSHIHKATVFQQIKSLFAMLGEAFFFNKKLRSYAHGKWFLFCIEEFFELDEIIAFSDTTSVMASANTHITRYFSKNMFSKTMQSCGEARYISFRAWRNLQTSLEYLSTEFQTCTNAFQKNVWLFPLAPTQYSVNIWNFFV